jgi:transposase-like protein
MLLIFFADSILTPLQFSEGFWTGFFDELKDRDLKGIELVVSDGHKGIQAAVSSRFLGAS